jgi:hypothetical protein
LNAYARPMPCLGFDPAPGDVSLTKELWLPSPTKHLTPLKGQHAVEAAWAAMVNGWDLMLTAATTDCADAAPACRRAVYRVRRPRVLGTLARLSPRTSSATRLQDEPISLARSSE